MQITYRNFSNSNDLQIQAKIWLEATKKLPLPWKPNKSQKWFYDQTNFDPKLKIFALDETNKEIGYISSILRQTVVPMGFPWFVSENTEDSQHYMFDKLYSYIREKYDRKPHLDLCHYCIQ